MGKLSQAIAEGEAISILVEVRDAKTARTAERQGADGLVAGPDASEVRASSELPLLYRGPLHVASGLAADAVVVPVDTVMWHEAQALGLEPVVRVTRPEELARALQAVDPEVFLLARAHPDDDPLEALLALLHDVPAGKLAIAELPDATADDIAELERAGVDAVLVSVETAAALVAAERPQV
ncbi:MAG TPA: hypothetical protein VNJ46_09190 [Gaiellaceae bacterium]|nr:hypothetical protein [Gaiellaceae bacterium]